MTAMAETSRGDWWLAKLGQGTRQEFDYVPEIEGRLPAGLAGTLYRNGPGLYERAGFKKWNLLDGDGMIRATSFADGAVRFRTRFVRTKKFEAEEKAGRFLYPTWTTPAPRRWENIPGYPSLGQAGVTAVVKDGRLHAFDEVGLPYGLDPASLETTGPLNPDCRRPGQGSLGLQGAYQDGRRERRLGLDRHPGSGEAGPPCPGEGSRGTAQGAGRAAEPAGRGLFPRFLLGEPLCGLPAAARLCSRPCPWFWAFAATPTACAGRLRREVCWSWSTPQASARR